MESFFRFLEILVPELGPIFWPMMVFCALCMFRKPLLKLLGNIEKVNVFGVGAKIGQRQKQSTEHSNTKIDAEFTQKLKDEVLSTPSLSHRVSLIKGDVDKINEEDREALLIQYLARNTQQREFEEAYRMIFTSQITLLRNINSFGHVGAHEEILRNHFDDVKNQNPDALLEFDPYFGFLIHYNLLKRLEGGNYCITDEGIDFLVWMDRMQLPGYKGPL